MFNSEYGFERLIEFINGHLSNRWNTIGLPLIASILYTLLIPFIRNGIKVINAIAWKMGETKTLKNLANGQIRINKYFSLREDFKKRTKILEDTIKEDSKAIKEFNDLNTNYLESKVTINNYVSQFSEIEIYLSNLRNVQILNGYWKSIYFNESKGEEYIYILDGGYYVVDPLRNKKKILFY